MNLLKDHSHRTQCWGSNRKLLLFFFVFWRSFFFLGGKEDMWAVRAVRAVGMEVGGERVRVLGVK